MNYLKLYRYNKCYPRQSITSCLSYSKRSSPYSHTVNAPKTDFPLSLEAVNQRELQIQEKCDFEGLYAWQQKESRREKFVMHDGPPYANGKVHVGHALNKILKDIINRYKLLRGFGVVYKPGWDCHGTPIEQKALSCVDRQTHTMGALEIRKMASEVAQESSREQKESFKSWGVMADWTDGCYYTYNPQYEALQLEAFFKLYEKGFVFQQYMPIFWSPSSRTALAESEIEYVDDFKSIQVFFKMPITQLPPQLETPSNSLHCTYALIWTTTPWTLPLNKAICYGEGVRYVLVEGEGGERFVVSEKFKPDLEDILASSVRVVSAFEGSQLQNTIYISTNGEAASFLPAAHVTSEKGTGLVHTAPAHGVEDFQVALKHGLSLDCLVDEEGRYMEGVGEDLQGKAVLTEGNELVLERWSGQVLEKSSFSHSYPHDWRTKQPILIRASKQWFVNTNHIKQAALAGIESINSYPTSSHHAMRARLESRDYWCISRQRYWGVPLPVFYNKYDGQPLINRASIDHLKTLFHRHGSDCWWKMDTKQLLPPSLSSDEAGGGEEVYEKGSDILDIWFDSGVSWFCVLDGEGMEEEGAVGRCDSGGRVGKAKVDGGEVENKGRDGGREAGDEEGGVGGAGRSVEGSCVDQGRGADDARRVADVYLEGLDQYGGWFMSSLLTSTAIQATPPFKNLVVHGFALDEQGRKMSKSLGNVVDPAVVVRGDKNSTGYGVDVLRTWVAGSGLEPAVVIGPSVLEETKQKLFRLRKSLRYLIGSLHDYQPSKQPITELHLTDQYMLHQLSDLIGKVSEAYDSFNISRVSRLLDHFNSSKLSAFYLHVVKDRLYCGDVAHRRSVQQTMHNLLLCLCKLSAPITPHLSEEVFQYHPLKQVSSSVFKTSDWLENDWENQSLATTYEAVQPIRQALFQLLGSEKPGDFELHISASQNLLRSLKLLHHPSPSSTSALSELMGVLYINLLEASSLSSSFSSSSSSSSSSFSSSLSSSSSSPSSSSPSSSSSSPSSSSSSFSSSSSSSPSFSTSSASFLTTKNFGDFELQLRRSERSKCVRCRRRCCEEEGVCTRCAEVLVQAGMKEHQVTRKQAQASKKNT